MPGARQKELDSLRLKIAALETQPVLAGAVLSQPMAARGVFPLPTGTLSEIFADSPRDCGAALGFALGLARGQLTPARSALILLQLADAAQEMGLPYGHGVVHHGLDQERIVLARPKTMVELLWAMEEAIACRAVGAVIADIGRPQKILDFTASRRLSLRSAEAGSSAFLLRYGREREASAARFRWRIAPQTSGAMPFDARAPGPPRWRVVLEKGRLRLGKPASTEEDYLVDWTSNGFVLADIDSSNGKAGTGQAIPRPQPAALGNRLSQAS